MKKFRARVNSVGKARPGENAGFDVTECKSGSVLRLQIKAVRWAIEMCTS